MLTGCCRLPTEYKILLSWECYIKEAKYILMIINVKCQEFVLLILPKMRLKLTESFSPFDI